MRTTQHNGRVSANGGAFLAGHNDREGGFAADHIDSSLTPENLTWTCYKDLKGFDDAERRFYHQHLQKGLDARNARYTAQRHPERCQTIDELRRSPKGCPEEQILQIGKAGDAVDAAILWQAAMKQISWEQRHFPGVHYLDIALHVDEPGAAPHIHARRVWVAHDRDGYEIVGQGKALREMGIDRPHPEKPVDRYNNAKVSYTAICREHFAEVCRGMGLEIETEPQQPGRSGLTLMQLKARTALEQAARAEEQARIATAAARKPAVPPKKAFLRPNKVVIDREEYDALQAAAGQRDAAARDAIEAAKERQERKRALQAAKAAQKAAEAAQSAAQRTLREAQEESRKIIQDAVHHRTVDDKLAIARLEADLREYRQMETAHPQQFRQMRAEQQRSRNRNHNRNTERS